MERVKDIIVLNLIGMEIGEAKNFNKGKINYVIVIEG